jgi:hypothetical protein
MRRHDTNISVGIMFIAQASGLVRALDCPDCSSAMRTRRLELKYNNDEDNVHPTKGSSSLKQMESFHFILLRYCSAHTRKKVDYSLPPHYIVCTNGAWRYRSW